MEARYSAGLLLVEIDSGQLEFHGGAALQREKQIQHRVGVFAAGKADHNVVARFYHLVVFNRLANVFSQPFLEFAQGYAHCLILIFLKKAHMITAAGNKIEFALDRLQKIATMRTSPRRSSSVGRAPHL